MIKLFESDLRPMQYWHMQAMDKLNQWASGKQTGYSTGFEHMDWYGKLEPGTLVLLAARPSQGKTQLALQMVENASKQFEGGGVAAVFSAEMPGDSLLMRLASARSGVNAHRLRLGVAKPDEVERMRLGLDSLKHLPLWIDDNSGPNTQQMLEQLSRLNEDVPVRLMMFDFVELANPDSKAPEDIRVGQIAHALKGIAKALQIPVLALSQLSRDVEKRANKRPVLSDLRYSGMLEQLADQVIFIMRPEYYDERQMQVECPEDDKKGIAYIDFAKNRNGPVGGVRLGFSKERVEFFGLKRVPLEKE